MARLVRGRAACIADGPAIHDIIVEEGRTSKIEEAGSIDEPGRIVDALRDK